MPRAEKGANASAVVSGSPRRRRWMWPSRRQHRRPSARQRGQAMRRTRQRGRAEPRPSEGVRGGPTVTSKIEQQPNQRSTLHGQIHVDANQLPYLVVAVGMESAEADGGGGGDMVVLTSQDDGNSSLGSCSGRVVVVVGGCGGCVRAGSRVELLLVCVSVRIRAWGSARVRLSAHPRRS